ncbi:hypothetical protein ACS0TY_015817 [Phlomoides rotata]
MRPIYNKILISKPINRIQFQTLAAAVRLFFGLLFSGSPFSHPTNPNHTPTHARRSSSEAALRQSAEKKQAAGAPLLRFGGVHSNAYLDSLKTSLNVATIVEVLPVALLPNCLVDKHVLYPFRKQST